MTEYGSIVAVKAKLQPTDDAIWPAALDDILGGIQKAITAAMDYELGRSFGAVAADTTQIIYGGPAATVLLPVPARSITSVVVGGTVSAGTVTGGDTYASSQWEHYPVDRDGNVLGLRLVSGGWWGGSDRVGAPTVPVVVTGDFVDSDLDTEVPDDITEVANFLIAETYKIQSASPAGFTGPDGSTVPIRDPWTDPLVKRTLSRWRVVNRIPAF